MGAIVRRGPPIDKTVLAIPAVQPRGEEPVESRRESDRIYGPQHRWTADGWVCVLKGLRDSVTGKRHKCRGRVTAHHLEAIGTGGEDADGEVPACVQAHDEFHSRGDKEVARRYQIDPWEVALRLLMRWQKFTGRTGAEQ